MRFNRKAVWLAMLLWVPLVVSGCGGIGASGSISPATFLLPGFVKGTPGKAPAPAPGQVPEAARTVASTR